MAAKKTTKKTAKKPTKRSVKGDVTNKPVKAAPKTAPKVSAKVAKALVVANKICETLGRPVIRPASELETTYHIRRPTGVIDLDIDMGGGVPAGGCIALSGADNSGKTHLLYMIFAMHQRIYGSQSVIALAYTEWEPDYWQMRFAGVQVAIPDSVIADANKARSRANLPPFSAEERAELKRQVGVVDVIHGETSEETLNAVLSVVQANCYGIVGIDSMTMLTPKAEDQKELDDIANVRSRAGLISRFMSMLHPTLTRAGENNQTAMVLINQVRANTDRAMFPSAQQRYIQASTSSQTYAERHGIMQNIVLSSGEKVRSRKGGKSHVTGKQIKWFFKKGSKGAHDNTVGETYFSYDCGIDPYHGLVPAGMRCGLIQEIGGHLTLYDGVGDPILEGINGPEHFAKILKEDPTLDMDIREHIVTKTTGTPCIYR